VKEDLFRKEALKHRKTRELAYKPVIITFPWGWVALLAIIVLLAGGLFWSFQGSISVRLHGTGSLVSDGGRVTINSHSEGVVWDVGVQTGERVIRGQVIARLDHPERVEEILQLLESIEWGKRMGVSDPSNNQLLQTLRTDLEWESFILSHEEGKVSEVEITKGQYLRVGDPVATIIRGGETVKELVGVFYFPVEEGKKIKPGMEAQIIPSTVPKEEYGFLKGNVISVSTFPASQKHIAQLIGSESFAQEMAQQIVLEVVVDLLPSPKTVSGFQWSSSDGPPFEIENGTMAQGTVIIERLRPIGLVFPELRKVFQSSTSER